MYFMSYEIDPICLDKLAYLSIKRGVSLQKGQNLLITAPLESLPLVRKICEHAYKEGANIVTPIFSDTEITLFNPEGKWLSKFVFPSSPPLPAEAITTQP